MRAFAILLFTIVATSALASRVSRAPTRRDPRCASLQDEISGQLGRTQIQIRFIHLLHEIGRKIQLFESECGENDWSRAAKIRASGELRRCALPFEHYGRTLAERDGTLGRLNAWGNFDVATRIDPNFEFASGEELLLEFAIPLEAASFRRVMPHEHRASLLRGDIQPGAFDKLASRDEALEFIIDGMCATSLQRSLHLRGFPHQ